MCEAENNCAEDLEGETYDCSEDSEDMKACVSAVEELSGGCQDAFADFYECAADVDSCESNELASECGEEVGELIEECSDESVEL
jgi:hypothetical protein